MHLKLVIDTENQQQIQLNETKGYGVNIHVTKISYIQVNSKQRNIALIAVFYLDT